VSRTQRLTLVLVLNLGLVAGLVAVGLTAHSLAVLAEGCDYLLDAAGAAVALLAIRLSARSSGQARLPGRPAPTDLAALFNCGWLFLLEVLVAAAAVERLITRTPEVHGLPVLVMSSAAAGTLYQKRFGASAAIAPAIAAQTTLSLLVLTVVVVVTGSSPAPSTLGGWACVGWLGLGPSCAGFAVFYAVLRRTSTVYVSSLLNLVPGGTALASVPILGEPLTLRVAIGLVIALAGMYVGVVLPGRREQPPRPVQPEPCPQSPPDASSRRPVQRAAR
jgi:hypothetical protein